MEIVFVESDRYIFTESCLNGNALPFRMKLLSERDLGNCTLEVTSSPTECLARKGKVHFDISVGESQISPRLISQSYAISIDFLRRISGPVKCSFLAVLYDEKGSELCRSQELSLLLYPSRWIIPGNEDYRKVPLLMGETGNKYHIFRKNLQNSLAKSKVMIPTQPEYGSSENGITEFFDMLRKEILKNGIVPTVPLDVGEFRIIRSIEEIFSTHMASEIEMAVFTLTLIQSLGYTPLVSCSSDNEILIGAQTDFGSTLFPVNSFLSEEGIKPSSKKTNSEPLSTEAVLLELQHKGLWQIGGNGASSSNSRESKYDIWKSNLLNIGRNNSLLNLPKSDNYCNILTKDIASLFDSLRNNNRIIIDPTAPATYAQTVKRLDSRYLVYEDKEGFSSFADGLHPMEDRKVIVPDPTQKLFAQMDKMDNAGEKYQVYLVFGIVKWFYEEDAFLSPLLLIPVQIERRNGPRRITAFDGCSGALVNPTLIHILKNRNIISSEESISFDPKKSDSFKALLKYFRENISPSGFDIKPALIMGIFSVGNQIIWNEMDAYSDLIQSNGVVKALLESPKGEGNEVFSDRDQFKDVRLIASADCSQQRAIDAALNEHTFILHGPPGTGKTQTIANIVSNLLGSGRKVLFVAEKQTALDGVYNKMYSAGLNGFCLSIDADSPRRTFNILKKMNTPTKVQPQNFEQKKYDAARKNYQLITDQLRDYNTALHSPAYFEMSVREMATEYFRDYKDGIEYLELDGTYLNTYTADSLRQLNRLMNNLRTELEGREFRDYPLSDSGITRISDKDIHIIEGLLSSLGKELAELDKDKATPLAWMPLLERNRLFRTVDKFSKNTSAEDLAFFTNYKPHSLPGITEYTEKNVQRNILSLTMLAGELDTVTAYYDSEYTPAVTIRKNVIPILESLRKTLLDGVGGSDTSFGLTDMSIGELIESSNAISRKLQNTTNRYFLKQEELSEELSGISSICTSLREHGLCDTFIPTEDKAEFFHGFRPIAEVTLLDSLPAMLSELNAFPTLLLSPFAPKKIDNLSEYIGNLESALAIFGPNENITQALHHLKMLLTAEISLEKVRGRSPLSEWTFSDDDVSVRAKKRFEDESGQFIEPYLFKCLTETNVGYRLQERLDTIENLASDYSKSLQEPAIQDNSEQDSYDCSDNIIKKITATLSYIDRIGDAFSSVSELHILSEMLGELEELLKNSCPAELQGHVSDIRKLLCKTEGQLIARCGWNSIWSSELLYSDEATYSEISKDVKEVASAGRFSVRRRMKQILGDCRFLINPAAPSEEILSQFGNLDLQHRMLACIICRLKDQTVPLLKTYLSKSTHLVEPVPRYSAGSGSIQDYARARLENGLRTIMIHSFCEWPPEEILAFCSNLLGLSEHVTSIRNYCQELDRCRKTVSSCTVPADILNNLSADLGTWHTVCGHLTGTGLERAGTEIGPSQMIEISRSVKELCIHITNANLLLSEYANAYSVFLDQQKESYEASFEELYGEIDAYNMEILHTKEVLEELTAIGCDPLHRFSIVRGFEDRIEQFLKRLDSVMKILVLERIIDSDSSLKKMISDCKTGLPDIRKWATLNFYEDLFYTQGFKEVYNLVKEGEPNEKVLDLFLKSLYRLALHDRFDNIQVLRNNNGNALNSLIWDYYTADRQLMDLNAKAIRYEIHSNIWNISRHSDNGSAGQLDELNRNANYGTYPNFEKYDTEPRTDWAPGTLKLDEIFTKFSEIIPTLTPCVMMSPTDVSQYLSLDHYFEKFDYVIFDEASQIFASNAICALARGKNAIIVGDMKQLAPIKNRGQSSQYSDKDIASRSILEESILQKIPETYLQWHFRSEHESLIDFSNKQFYRGTISTFPSVNDRSCKLGFMYGPGWTYSSENPEGNEGEARAILDYIRTRFSSGHPFSGKTICFIAFGLPQIELIRSLIKSQEYSDVRTYLDRYIITYKNLETVQGDEYDTVLISVGYGRKEVFDSKLREQVKKVTLNFGPLNNAGEGRRINVALTRSIQEMLVFSSVCYSDLKEQIKDLDADTGLIAFLQFLKYVSERPETDLLNKTDSSSNLETSTNGSNDTIAWEIKKRLEDKGYLCDLNVGQSNFHIDLAVFSPEDPERYLLGIMTDGETFRDTLNLREKYFAQEYLLRERYHWDIMRIWTVDFFRCPDEVIDNIANRLEISKLKVKISERLGSEGWNYKVNCYWGNIWCDFVADIPENDDIRNIGIVIHAHPVSTNNIINSDIWHISFLQDLEDCIRQTKHSP